MVWPFGKKAEKKAGKDSQQEHLDYKQRHILLQREQLQKLRNDKKVYSVKIVRCNCDASIAIMDKIFPFGTNIPRIPLPNCSNPDNCKCQYQGMRDKRFLPDRRKTPDRRDAMRVDKDERRKNHGRRKEDSSWEQYDKF